MIRRPPISTRTDTLCPYTTLFRSGMMTRDTMLFCVAGIVVAILATPLRRQLATPWPWVGVALSLLVFAPNAWWQWQHGFVYLDFVEHIHARDVRDRKSTRLNSSH